MGLFGVEVAKNASGEVFDWDSGTDLRVRQEDRSPFSGGKRVLVDGLLTRGQTWGIAVAGYLVAAAVGLSIVGWREERVLWFGLAGIGLAFFYHAPPFRLSYRGLGELAVAVAYGPLVCCGTYLVQRGTLPTEIVLLSLPLGILIAAFLWINEFPDYAADALSGKRTLVVRLGRVRAAQGFAWLGVAAASVLASLPAAGLPSTVWLGSAAALRYIPAARILLATPEDTARSRPRTGDGVTGVSALRRRCFHRHVHRAVTRGAQESFAGRSPSFHALDPMLGSHHSPGGVMKLAKLNPILGNVEKIDRLFDPFLTGPLFPELATRGFEATWVPTLDLAENDKAFMVRIEVPGMPKENLDVKLTGEVLTITGHREAAKEVPGENFLYRERETGKFVRTIRLPAAVMEGKIEAHYTDGVLNVTLPKAAPEVRSKITIK